MFYHLKTSVILMANSHRIRNLSKTTTSVRGNSICASLSPAYRHVHHVAYIVY